MILYFSHSRSFDFEKEYYEPIRNSSLGKDFELVFPHATADQFVNAKDLFESGNVKAVIAEGSFPAIGQGIELGWADDRNIPIIAIHKADVAVSGSLKMVAKAVLPYSDSVSMIQIIEQSLKEL
jgi:hypothetical protein